MRIISLCNNFFDMALPDIHIRRDSGNYFFSPFSRRYIKTYKMHKVTHGGLRCYFGTHKYRESARLRLKPHTRKAFVKTGQQKSVEGIVELFYILASAQIFNKIF